MTSIRCLVSFFVVLSCLALSGCGGLANSLLSGITGSTPIITSVTPNPVAPGQAITVNGQNLNGTLTTVYFYTAGSTAASGSTIASSGSTTTIIATVPTGLPAATYNIDVVTTDSSGDVSSPSNSVTLTVS